MLTFCFAYSYKDASKTAGLCHKKSFNLNQILDKGQASKIVHAASAGSFGL